MNDLIDWSDELSVGIQEINEQHKVLLDITKELNEDLHDIRRKEVRLEVLDELIDYAKVHFAVEESLMRIFDYPHYEEHKAEHDCLITEIGVFREKFVQDNNAPIYDLLIFQKKWLIDHIMKVDKHYKQHFIKMGVQKTWLNNACLGKFWH